MRAGLVGVGAGCRWVHTTDGVHERRSPRRRRGASHQCGAADLCALAWDRAQRRHRHLWPILADAARTHAHEHWPTTHEHVPLLWLPVRVRLATHDAVLELVVERHRAVAVGKQAPPRHIHPRGHRWGHAVRIQRRSGERRRRGRTRRRFFASRSPAVQIFDDAGLARLRDWQVLVGHSIRSNCAV
jgi:hypothetical protein